MDGKHRWRVQNTRMQTGYVPSNYVRKEKPSIFDSIKKKVSFFNEKREQVVSPFFLSQVKGGGNQGAGSRTLPSSNSSPVHSVPPPPHTSKIILPLIQVGEILIFFMSLLSNVTLYYVWTATNESFLHNTISTTIFSIPLLHRILLLLRYESYLSLFSSATFFSTPLLLLRYESSSTPFSSSFPSSSDMKSSGNRQPTTTENSEPISSAIVKYNYQVKRLQLIWIFNEFGS